MLIQVLVLNNKFKKKTMTAYEKQLRDFLSRPMVTSVSL